MTKLTLYVISDRIQKPKSFLAVDGTWKDLGEDTKFFEKRTHAHDALYKIELQSAGVETFTITVD
jgi:hypothetical protein